MLTGVLVVSCNWLIFHSLLVTTIVSLLVGTWWYIFLYSYPQVRESTTATATIPFFFLVFDFSHTYLLINQSQASLLTEDPRFVLLMLKLLISQLMNYSQTFVFHDFERLELQEDSRLV